MGWWASSKTSTNTLVGNSIIPDMVNAIIRWFGTLATSITAPIQKFITAVVTGITGLASKAVLALRALYTGIRGWFSSQPWAVLISALMIPKIVSEIGKLWTKAKVKFQTFITSLKGFFSKDKFASIGQNIIDGIGSKLSGSALIEKAKGLAESIKSAFTSALGIQSPSTVFAGYALNIGQGIVGGIVRAIPIVRAAGQRLGSSISNGFENTFSAGTVDLSGTQSLFGQVRGVVSGLKETADHLAGVGMDQVKTLAETGGAISELIPKFASSMGSLKFIGAYGVGEEEIARFRFLLERVATHLANVAWNLRDSLDRLKTMVEIGEGFASLIPNFTKGVASLSQLGMISVNEEHVARFRHLLERLATHFAVAAYNLRDVLGTITPFVEIGQKISSLVPNFVAGLGSLATIHRFGVGEEDIARFRFLLERMAVHLSVAAAALVLHLDNIGRFVEIGLGISKLVPQFVEGMSSLGTVSEIDVDEGGHLQIPYNPPIHRQPFRGCCWGFVPSPRQHPDHDQYRSRNCGASP